MPNPFTLYSAAEVVQILRVTPAEVLVACESGELEASRIGGRYRITEDALTDYLAKTRVSA